MPCYDPPRPDRDDYREVARQRDRLVATLKGIDAYCGAMQGGGTVLCCPCPACDALPGSHCTSSSGRRTRFHAARRSEAHGASMTARMVLDIIDGHWE